MNRDELVMQVYWMLFAWDRDYEAPSTLAERIVKLVEDNT